MNQFASNFWKDFAEDVEDYTSSNPIQDPAPMHHYTSKEFGYLKNIALETKTGNWFSFKIPRTLTDFASRDVDECSQLLALEKETVGLLNIAAQIVTEATYIPEPSLSETELSEEIGVKRRKRRRKRDKQPQNSADEDGSIESSESTERFKEATDQGTIPKLLDVTPGVLTGQNVDMIKSALLQSGLNLVELQKGQQPYFFTDIQPALSTEVQPTLDTDAQPPIYSEVQPPLFTEVEPALCTEVQPTVCSEVQPTLSTDSLTPINREVHPTLCTQVQPTLCTDIEPTVSKTPNVPESRKRIEISGPTQNVPMLSMKQSENIQEVRQQSQHQRVVKNGINRKQVVLPVKLWIRVPFNKTTKRLCQKLKIRWERMKPVSRSKPVLRSRSLPFQHRDTGYTSSQSESDQFSDETGCFEDEGASTHRSSDESVSASESDQSELQHHDTKYASSQSGHLSDATVESEDGGTLHLRSRSRSLSTSESDQSDSDEGQVISLSDEEHDLVQASPAADIRRGSISPDPWGGSYNCSPSSMICDDDDGKNDEDTGESPSAIHEDDSWTKKCPELEDRAGSPVVLVHRFQCLPEIVTPGMLLRKVGEVTWRINGISMARSDSDSSSSDETIDDDETITKEADMESSTKKTILQYQMRRLKKNQHCESQEDSSSPNRCTDEGSKYNMLQSSTHPANNSPQNKSEKEVADFFVGTNTSHDQNNIQTTISTDKPKDQIDELNTNINESPNQLDQPLSNAFVQSEESTNQETLYSDTDCRTVVDESGTLDLPCMFDDRDCLSIFDEFDIDIDSDLFSNKQQSPLDEIESQSESQSVGHPEQPTPPKTDPPQLVEEQPHILECSSELVTEQQRESPSPTIDEEYEAGIVDDIREVTGSLSSIEDLEALIESCTTEPELDVFDKESPSTPAVPVENKKPEEEQVPKQAPGPGLPPLQETHGVPEELLIPRGYCFDYVSGKKCLRKKCVFKHEQPKKDAIFTHCMERIQKMLSVRNIKRAISLYRYIKEKVPDQPVPPILLCNLLHATMMPATTADMFYILAEITKQNLFNAHICNCVIRLCRCQYQMYQADIERIIFAVISLNIGLDADCKLTLLEMCHFFGNKMLLWELLSCQAICCEGFSVPEHILVPALKYITSTPHPGVVGRFQKWLQAVPSTAVMLVNPDVLQSVHNSLKQSLHLKDTDLVKFSHQQKLTKIQAPITESSQPTCPISKVCQREDYKSFFHRISGCKHSKDWSYLSEMFVELCAKKDLDNSYYFQAYISALENDKAPSQTVLNVKSFLSNVLKEQQLNVFLTVDTLQLSQIISLILIKLCKRGSLIEAVELIQLVLQKDSLHLCPCPKDINVNKASDFNSVVITCLRTCQRLRRFNLCTQILEVYGTQLQSAHFDSKELKDCISDVFKDLFCLPGCPYNEAVLVKTFIQTCSQEVKMIVTESQFGYHDLMDQLSTKFLQFGDWLSAQETFELLHTMMMQERPSPMAVRKLVSASAEAHLELPDHLLQFCLSLVDYPPQNSHGQRRCLTLQLGMTSCEIKIIIECYMKNVYSFLCQRLHFGHVLTLNDLHLQIKVLHGLVQPLDVPFLGSAPRDLIIFRQATLKILQILKLEAELCIEAGYIDLSPYSIGKFLQDLDIRGGKPQLCHQIDRLLRKLNSSTNVRCVEEDERVIKWKA